jgi:hypothetical protein
MSKPFHVYLDLDVLNNDTNPASKAPQLSFEETRTQPFLDGTADDYFVAIARFSIQTGGTLPVFIPAIQTGQSDPNLTVYAITLNYNGVDGTAYIRHVPQPSATPPAPPTTVQDLSGDYYYVYNYQDWISMVNAAFVTAAQQLVANLAAANTSVITQNITLSAVGPVTLTTSTLPLKVPSNLNFKLQNCVQQRAYPAYIQCDTDGRSLHIHCSNTGPGRQLLLVRVQHHHITCIHLDPGQHHIFR